MIQFLVRKLYCILFVILVLIVVIVIIVFPELKRSQCQ
jgi:hypothetical protein